MYFFNTVRGKESKVFLINGTWHIGTSYSYSYQKRRNLVLIVLSVFNANIQWTLIDLSASGSLVYICSSRKKSVT